VVILVDNDVRRDSRVQKQAHSMADAGWDVVLLGKASGQQGERWQIGQAEVRLLPVGRTRRPHELRTPLVRDPFAYPLGPIAGQRRRQVEAARADLGAHPSSVRRLTVGVRARWVELRVRHTERLRTARKELTGTVDRLTTDTWRRTMGARAWRRLDPHLWDFELAYGPVIDSLRPDIVHANDWVMLGVGARARLRADGSVKLVWDAHEFLPEMKPWNDHPRWHLAQLAHEREYAPYADAVVTVSPVVADLLEDKHGLKHHPSVVMNCPAFDQAAGSASVREAAGVADGVPILLYSGNASPARGMTTMVEALPSLPGVACVFVVAKPDSEHVQELVARAAELGVGDRVHLAPYVPFDQVVGYLSSATVGVIPIHKGINEIALNTKFFEYSHARLPIICSDVKVMAEQVQATGQGEVFEAQNVADFVRAAKLVLASPESYRAAYDKPGLLRGWTWDAQAKVLDRVYSRLLS